MIDDARYLLSPQDLMAVDLVPDLIKAGYLCCFQYGTPFYKHLFLI